MSKHPAVLSIAVALSLTGLAVAGAPEEAPHFTQFRSAGGTTCLAVEGTGAAARVILATCGDPALQAWRVDLQAQRIRYGSTNLCLQGRAPAAAGQPGVVALGGCEDPSAKGWVGTRGKATVVFKQTATGLCLDPAGKGASAAGTLVGLGTCDDTDQTWTPVRVATAPPTAPTTSAPTSTTSTASTTSTTTASTTSAPTSTTSTASTTSTTGASTTAAPTTTTSTASTTSTTGASTTAAPTTTAAPAADTRLVVDPLPSARPFYQRLRLRANGLCLNGPATGSVTLSTDCVDATSTWLGSDTGDLATAAYARCIGRSGGGLAMGTCKKDQPAGLDLVPVAEAPGFAHVIERASGQCLVASAAVAGATVGLGACDAGDRALWTWADDPSSAGNEPDKLLAAGSVAVVNGELTKPWTDGIVPVCFEQSEWVGTKEAEKVRHAVEGQWGAVANITFTGWGKCPAPKVTYVTNTSGSSVLAKEPIRIIVSDTGGFNWPRSLLGPWAYAGQQTCTRTNDDSHFRVDCGDGYAPNMLLNFSFNNFDAGICSKMDAKGDSNDYADDVAQCIENIAVHEFGHALGFRHEQASSDTPADCTDRQAGGDNPNSADVSLTLGFDQDSVMNYCAGRADDSYKYLSKGDIDGVVKLYGEGRPGLTIFQSANYLGAGQTVREDTPSLEGRVADKASSLYLINHLAVAAVYSDANYGGVCETITTSRDSMGGSLVDGDSISSVRVGKNCDGTTSTTPTALLYADAGQKGAAVTMYTTELSHLSARGLNDAVSSVHLGDGVAVAALYQDADFKGKCVEVYGDTNVSDTDLGNDSLSSVRLGVDCHGNPNVPTSGLRLFADVGAPAAQARLVGGDVADLDEYNLHDRISGVQLFGGVTAAALYADDNYAGSCLSLYADEMQLSNVKFNDSADSLRVGQDCWGNTARPANAVTLCDDAGGKGLCLDLSKDVASLGGLNFGDTASSVAFKGNVTVAALYQDANFSGVCTDITGPVDLSSLGVNDSASSIRVGVTCSGSTAPPTTGVELYMDAGYAGAKIFADKDIPQLSARGWNDAVSSLKLKGVSMAAVYSDANYAGTCLYVSGDLASLSGLAVQGDSASSIRVGVNCQGTTTVPTGGLTVYDDSKYRGSSLSVTGDLASMPSGWNDTISSITFWGTTVTRAAVYKDKSYGGSCFTVTGPVSSLSDAGFGNDNISSIRLNKSCGEP